MYCCEQLFVFLSIKMTEVVELNNAQNENASIAIITGVDLAKLGADAQIDGALLSFGINAADLQSLIEGKFPFAGEPGIETIRYGDVDEEVVVRVATMPSGKKIEVSDCKRAIKSHIPPETGDMQLRQKDHTWKILIVESGGLTIHIPNETEPAGYLYLNSNEGRDFHLPQGSIIAIQSPISFTITASEEDTHYYYISSPRHSTIGDRSTY